MFKKSGVRRWIALTRRKIYSKITAPRFRSSSTCAKAWCTGKVADPCRAKAGFSRANPSRSKVRTKRMIAPIIKRLKEGPRPISRVRHQKNQTRQITRWMVRRCHSSAAKEKIPWKFHRSDSRKPAPCPPTTVKTSFKVTRRALVVKSPGW